MQGAFFKLFFFFFEGVNAVLTTTSYASEILEFGEIAEVSTYELSWMSLALGNHLPHHGISPAK